jgi:metallo-beta-lactamase class B
MKTILTAITLLLCITTQAQKLEISHLVGNFYVYVTYGDYKGTPYPANGMYLITDAGAVLFDCPWDHTQFQPLLDSIKTKHGKDAILCIPTHFHNDRTAGLDYFSKKGIKTYSTVYTQQLCKENNEPVAQYNFTRDTTFTIGGYTFETYYPGKGHAPDNIVLWFPEDKILYGGCFVKDINSPSLGNLSHADPKEWKTSMEKTMKKYPSPKYVIPGHGSWEDPKSLQHTMKLLKEFKK